MPDNLEMQVITCPQCDGPLVVVLGVAGADAQFACETCKIAAKQIITEDGYAIRLVVGEMVN